MVNRAPLRLVISSFLWSSACQLEMAAEDIPPSDDSSTGSADEDLDGSSGTGSSGDVCGDGEVGPSERCDDGINDGAYGGCTPDCAGLGPRCGDGRVNPQEQCDGEPECSSACVLPGGMLWLRTFEGDPEVDEAGLAVAVASHDEIVVVGHQEPPGADRRGFVRAHDSDGELAWEHVIEAAPGWLAEAHGVAIDGRDDSIVAIGHTIEATASQGADLWLAKLDATGNPAWIHSFGATASALGRSVTIDEEGSIYAAGEVDGTRWLRAYDGDGRPGWTATFGTSPTSLGGITSVASGQSIAVAGFTSSADRGPELWFGLHGRDGVPGWTRTLGNAQDVPELAHDIAVGPAGDIAVVGIAGEDTTRVWIGMYDPHGEPRWIDEGPTVTRLHLQREGVRAVAFGQDGSLFVVGAVQRAGEVVLRKYDPSGTVAWERAIPLQGDGIAHGMAIDSHGYVVVTGSVTTEDRDEGWFAKFAP